MSYFRLALVVCALLLTAPRAGLGEQPWGGLVNGGGTTPHEVQLAQQFPADADAQAGSAAIARLNFRISELEQELRAATGRVEELNYRVRQLESRLDKLDSDVDYRLSDLERPGSATAGEPSTPAPPPTATSPTATPPTPTWGGEGARPAPSAAEGGPTVLGQIPRTGPESARAASPTATPQSPPERQTEQVLPEGTPREQYAYAFNLLRNADYDAAESAFDDFLARHPNDALSPNARYWLGETHYVRGDYAQAAEVFLEGYQSSKTGPKAADTLLKLGMSLANLDKTREACATFAELEQKLPDASSVIKQKAENEQRRLGCR